MTGICATITSLPCALFWGAISVSGIIVGALIGIFAPLTHRAIAATMAVAAGLLLAAATVELAVEAITMTSSLAGGFAAFMIGAVGFSWANSILRSVGAGDRKRCGECVSQPSETSNPGSGNAIALGTAMDAIPEALVLGLTLKTHGPEAALIAAIALGNLPEAISGSAGMQAAGRSVKWILGVWGTVAVSTVVLTGAGFWVAGSLSQSLTAALQLFGAGALIAMVTETIIPEAVHGTPKFAGTIAAAGFAALLLLGVSWNSGDVNSGGSILNSKPRNMRCPYHVNASHNEEVYHESTEQRFCKNGIGDEKQEHPGDCDRCGSLSWAAWPLQRRTGSR